jgi:hypothetical protein
VLLEQSSVSVARSLFSRLRRIKHPSLAWVQWLAEYCDDRRAASCEASTRISSPEESPDEPCVVSKSLPRLVSSSSQAEFHRLAVA